MHPTQVLEACRRFSEGECVAVLHTFAGNPVDGKWICISCGATYEGPPEALSFGDVTKMIRGPWFCHRGPLICTCDIPGVKQCDEHGVSLVTHE